MLEKSSANGVFIWTTCSSRLIHAYLGIDDDTIWSIIQDDIPVLISALEVFKEEAK